MSEAIFDLEQAVMNCWEIVDDLKLLRKTVPGLSAAEEVQEQIQAIESVYQMRFDNMWMIFEELCAEHHKYRLMAEGGRGTRSDFNKMFNDIDTDLLKDLPRNTTQDVFDSLAKDAGYKK